MWDINIHKIFWIGYPIYTLKFLSKYMLYIYLCMSLVMSSHQKNETDSFESNTGNCFYTQASRPITITIMLASPRSRRVPNIIQVITFVLQREGHIISSFLWLYPYYLLAHNAMKFSFSWITSPDFELMCWI